MSKETLSEDDAKTVALNLCGKHGTKSINPTDGIWKGRILRAGISTPQLMMYVAN